MNPRKLVEDLKKSGLSDHEIAREAHVSQPTITRIKRGISGGSLRVALSLQEAHGRIFSMKIIKEAAKSGSNA